MTALDRTVLLLAVLWAVAMLFVLAAVAFSSTVTTQVSHGLPTSTVYLQSLPQSTSTRVVYVQDATTLGAHELWSVGMFEDAPIRLSNALASGQSVKFRIAPDGQRVVYQTDQTTRGIPDLYSAPIAGGASVKLSMALAALPGQVRDFLVSPDSQRAYYAADGAVNNKLELWAVSVLGGRSIRLNHSINVATDVFEYNVSPQDFVVYRAGQSSGSGDHKLYAVCGDGLAPAYQISRAMVTGGAVDEFKIAGDGSAVAYIADADSNGEFNLYSVPIVGGVSVRLNAVSGGVVDFLLSRNGGTEIVTYEQETEAVTSWWSVPVTGGTPVAVPPPMPEPVRSPDGQWIVYHVGTALWGSGPSGLHRRVSCLGQAVTTTFLAKPAYSITPDSTRVVYIAEGDVWTSPLTGAVCLIFRDGFEGGSVGEWG